MRDLSGYVKSFENAIIQNEESIQRRIEKLKKGEIAKDRITIVEQQMSSTFLSISICKYSAGYSLAEVCLDLVSAVDYTIKSWDGFWKLKDKDGNEYDQYILSAYDEMIWMLSLGYLLNVSDDIFMKLVEVIDRDNVKDLLFEFIISAKIKSREPLKEESYRKYFGVPEVFSKLREAIRVEDKVIAENLVKEFITKNWYKNHKDASWYNSHKSKFDIYYGYWSFETAAVVKIMGLEDSNFRDCKYYPKDLL